jgi:hypothetical protein
MIFQYGKVLLAFVSRGIVLPTATGGNYLLQGQMTYHQEGKPDLVANPGDGFSEGRATSHWGESAGKVPAVWIAVDIPKP